ncbi:hypothetical protein EDB85DRAFT_1512617 [Lactarius pseudohatsudake]|nr:hypothetical protein EDB85DRAFT_1512617 [Lactarius pseudohatsudake]
MKQIYELRILKLKLQTQEGRESAVRGSRMGTSHCLIAKTSILATGRQVSEAEPLSILLQPLVHDDILTLPPHLITPRFFKGLNTRCHVLVDYAVWLYLLPLVFFSNTPGLKRRRPNLSHMPLVHPIHHGKPDSIILNRPYNPLNRLGKKTKSDPSQMKLATQKGSRCARSQSSQCTGAVQTLRTFASPPHDFRIKT